MSTPSDNSAEAIEAAVFRRLVQHLDENKDVQNIDLMNLAGFCRNCLSKWYVAAAEERGVNVDYEGARSGSTACRTASGSPGINARQTRSNWPPSTTPVLPKATPSSRSLRRTNGL